MVILHEFRGMEDFCFYGLQILFVFPKELYCHFSSEMYLLTWELLKPHTRVSCRDTAVFPSTCTRMCTHTHARAHR